MAQKNIGYVELEWTCERCGTRNPGTAEKCAACGAAMPEDARFELPASQQLISDEKKLERAQSGPDVHCPYCGARNAAGAEKCAQCSAPLGEATARQSGQVVGAYHAGPAPDQPCPFCGEMNPATETRCKKCGGALGRPAAQAGPPATAAPAKKSKVGLGVAGGLIAALACVAVIILFIASRGTTDIWGRVESVGWERSIPIMALRPVEHEAWADDIPAGAPIGACADKYHHTEQEPVAGAREVCGTPYVLDQGSGAGKVVQDCQYEVYEEWCTYTVNEWQVVTSLTAAGADLSPRWPDVTLNAGQREGETRGESYRVHFKTDDKKGEYIYRPDTAGEFAQFVVGSEWMLTVNSLGGVTGVEPAK
jgi:ribosomal protein L40E